MSLIKVYDTSGVEFEKESVDVRECIEILGWSLTKPEQKEVKNSQKNNEPTSKQ